MHIRHIFHSESDLAQRLSQRFLGRWKRMLALYEEHRQRLSKGVALKCVSIAWAFCSAAMEGNAEVPCQIEDVLERHTQEWIEIDGEPFACEDAEVAEQLIWDTVCLMLEEDEPQPEWQYAFDIAGGHSAYAYKREVLEEMPRPRSPFRERASCGETQTAKASNDYQTTASKGGTTIINNYIIIYNKENMDIDIEKLAKAVANGINLDGFKGDLVAVKVVENEIGNIEPGGIGVQNVYGGASQASQPPKGENGEGEIVDELLGIFYGDREKARDFVGKVQTMKDTDICQYVKSLVKEKTISELSCKKDLWQVLHDHGIYKAGVRNWNKQIG